MSSSIYVLDSFVILAYLMNEEGSDRVEEILRLAKSSDMKLYGNIINLGEVYYNLFRQFPNDEAATSFALMKSWPVSWVEVDEPMVLSAARLKSVYPIAYADCFAAATAKHFDATLLTGDPEFKLLQREINVDFIS